MPSRDRTPKWKFPVFFSGSLLLIYFIGNITGILQFYTAPSASNEPVIKENSSFLTSIFKKPNHNDFIVYVNAKTTESNVDEEYSVHRLCGMPGDTIVIIDGVLFVNGKNVDEQLHLKHQYRMSAIAYAELKNHGHELFADAASDTETTEDSVDLFLPDNIAYKASYAGRRLIMPTDYVDDAIKQKFNAPWNQDQFGPVVVPADSYFVLGDNRNASADSRYNGFVAAKDWRRTVLTH